MIGYPVCERGREQQRGGAGGLRGGHRGAVEHRVAEGQRVAGLGDVGLLGCQVGMVEMAEPGAMTFGLKPPSSRGPREEKLCRVGVLETAEP